MPIAYLYFGDHLCMRVRVCVRIRLLLSRKTVFVITLITLRTAVTRGGWRGGGGGGVIRPIYWLLRGSRGTGCLKRNRSQIDREKLITNEREKQITDRPKQVSGLTGRMILQTDRENQITDRQREPDYRQTEGNRLQNDRDRFQTDEKKKQITD